jgi:hypothetical protein
MSVDHPSKNLGVPFTMASNQRPLYPLFGQNPPSSRAVNDMDSNTSAPPLPAQQEPRPDKPGSRAPAPENVIDLCDEVHGEEVIDLCQDSDDDDIKSTNDDNASVATTMNDIWAPALQKFGDLTPSPRRSVAAADEEDSFATAVEEHVDNEDELSHTSWLTQEEQVLRVPLISCKTVDMSVTSSSTTSSRDETSMDESSEDSEDSNASLLDSSSEDDDDEDENPWETTPLVERLCPAKTIDNQQQRTTTPASNSSISSSPGQALERRHSQRGSSFGIPATVQCTHTISSPPTDAWAQRIYFATLDYTNRGKTPCAMRLIRSRPIQPPNSSSAQALGHRERMHLVAPPVETTSPDGWPMQTWSVYGRDTGMYDMLQAPDMPTRILPHFHSLLD